MKKVTMAIASAAVVIMIAGSMATHAGDNGGHFKDIDELKQLHAAFHDAVSHAGLDPAQHLTDILAIWTDDGRIQLNTTVPPTVYSGKGEQVPGTATCEEGANGGTLCAFFAYHASSFVSGRDWVSLTPIFTEAIRVVDGNDADIYYQCIYFDVTTNPPTFKSNVTFGLPGTPGVPGSWTPAHARKVNGKWLLSDTYVESIAPPAFDVSPNP